MGKIVSKKELNKNISFSFIDYRRKNYEHNNESSVSLPLNKIVSDYFKGEEIGSDMYMSQSPFRFLRTGEISDSSLLLDFSTVQNCLPVRNLKQPKKGDILIVKDSKDLLGNVAFYNEDNSSGTDYVSAGIIDIDIKNEYDKFYVLGMLKYGDFKEFVDTNTPGGATMRHAKMIALEYPVKFPTKNDGEIDEDLVLRVSNRVKNIINKEHEILKKYETNNILIETELEKNSESINSFKITRNEIFASTRLDTGVFNKEYKEIMNSILKYSNGYMYIDAENLKGGNTPTDRVVNPERITNTVNWVRPTDITDFGYYNANNRIRFEGNKNLQKDALLFINRTSKGKLGRFVGISSFYDYSIYGEGHHNQGLYRYEDQDKEALIYIGAILNSKPYRKLCGWISKGSKMKEMRIEDFLSLPIPKIQGEIKENIVNNYYKMIDYMEPDTSSYLEYNYKRNKELGIFQLNFEINLLKKDLTKMLAKISVD